MLGVTLELEKLSLRPLNNVESNIEHLTIVEGFKQCLKVLPNRHSSQASRFTERPRYFFSGTSL